jgi:hypothetical protein
MQYPLLVLLVGWLVVQVLLVGGYFTMLAVVERRNVARVLLVSAGASLVALCLFVRAACHECLTFPSVAVCERRNDAVDTQIESNRSYAGGYIKERQFADCVFYWHENNTDGE